MFDILSRAGCFVIIIILGYVLRKVGLFQRSDFNVLSKIVIKITLPASIVASFADKQIDWALLSLAALGLGAGILYMGLAWLINKKGGKEHQAFAMVNLSGYNIGCFTLPFVQSFLGPAGVVIASLFDIGNACICLGGSYSIAAIVKDGGGFSLKKVGKNLIRSVALICYAVMILLQIFGLSLPSPVISLAEIIGGANAFLAMLMIGVGFRLEANRAQLGRIVKHLAARYTVAVLLALLCWFVLPFERAVRVVLVLLVFSPIGSAAPAYTAELDSDVGLASAVNSLTIVISIVIITALLTILL